ncbi:TetR/AcrR family transcriptional regulator [Cytobacillus sp. IB215665]|uniref:TetR/AcrR family transcriptional regulator n=1 Tax=Cytobacillus sp. IB215665 TaxID=3097357 RepID=UPI002A13471F|nr:TetR/AcrR family transcriptional regulator [Cytobacillus sp. IB215665]MDX8364639.1 TetR/AcrR family transcriptional regulator [Cytobacillus sp. IB215665]
MANKEDLRITRTRKLIGEAFLKLLQQKGFDSITIQNIADEAMINRATFYLHYQDKYDLLEQMMDVVLKELITSYGDSNNHIEEQQFKIKNHQMTIQRVYESVEKHRFFYQVMFGKHGVYEFRKNLEEVMIGKFEENFNNLEMTDADFKIPKEVLLHFSSSAFVGIIDWWLREENHKSPEEMSVMISQIILRGHTSAAGVEIR